jgi:hypothetical protein
MSAPKLRYVWSGEVNHALENVSTPGYIGWSAFLALKMHLCGEASGTEFNTDGLSRTKNWVVEQSSNGTLYGAADYWGTTVANLVSAVYTSPHSWIVLKFVGPTHTLRCCLDLNDPSTNYKGTISFTINSAYTGGTASNRPTSANELSPRLNAKTIPSDYVNIIDGSVPTGGTWYSHFSINETNGSFHFLLSKTGQPEFATHISLNILENYAVTDVAPIVASLCFGDTGSGNVVPSSNSTAGNESITSTRAAAALYSDASAVTSDGGINSPMNSGVSLESSSGQNTTDSSWYVTPVYFLNTSGVSNYRGEIPDVFYISANASNGDYYSHLGNKKLCVVGSMVLPFGATPTI